MAKGYSRAPGRFVRALIRILFVVIFHNVFLTLLHILLTLLHILLIRLNVFVVVLDRFFHVFRIIGHRFRFERVCVAADAQLETDASKFAAVLAADASAILLVEGITADAAPFEMPLGPRRRALSVVFRFLPESMRGFH